MNDIVRYNIPDTRLPFVNTEVETVNVKGTPYLVSSIWGGGCGGRLYFWNPEIRRHFMRKLPDPIPGAYMLKAGPDGGDLYLGCGNGDLLRYKGSDDVFETLVSGELHGITWGGVVTDRYVLWNASKDGQSGSAGVYDWRESRLERIFKPLDTRTPPGLYGHKALEAPDGRIVWSMNVPEARMLILDLTTMQVTSLDAPWLEGNTWTSGAFVDDETLVVFVGNAYTTAAAYLLRYPDFQIIRKLALTDPDATQHDYPVVSRGFIYRQSSATGDLYRFDPASGTCECLLKNWTKGSRGYLHFWNEYELCAVNTVGEVFRYNTETAATDGMDLEATGFLPAHALCAVPEKNLVVGAPFINQRFWTIDMQTGDGQDRGRAASGGGQVNQIIWDHLTSRALMSSYTSCSVTAYDPESPASWPVNPRELVSAHDDGQMRPKALLHDGEHVWMVTSPSYGTLGGALCRINTRTETMDIWRHIVPDQQIQSLVLDSIKRRVYCSSHIYADCNSAPPTQTTGRMVSFCMDKLEVLRADIIHETSIGVNVRALLEDGSVLVQEEKGDLHAWYPDTGEVRYLAPAPANFGSVLSWHSEYGVLCVAEGAVCRMHITDNGIRYERLTDDDGGFMHIAGDRLWCSKSEYVIGYPLSMFSQK